MKRAKEVKRITLMTRIGAEFVRIPTYGRRQSCVMLAVMNKPFIISCLALTFLCSSPLRADPADKPTCAVLNFDALEGVTPGESRILSVRFMAEFNRLDAYRLLPREKMDEILKAQKYSISENCSAMTCAIEVGKLLPIEYIVFGSVGKVGQTYTMGVNLANVESGEMEKSVTHDMKGEIDDVLTMGVKTLARKLVGGAAGRAEAGTGALPVGGAGLDDLVAEVRAKEDEQKRLEAERIEAQQRLAAEMLRRKAEFEKDYAAYLVVIGSKSADETMKRRAWERLTAAWGVKDAGAEPRGLRWDEATGLLVPTGLAASQGEAMALDLGNGVNLEFVWVAALKMWVGKYEVTNEEYRRFKHDHINYEYKGHSLNGGRQPVVMVNFDDAKAYAEWINRTYSGQLPAGYKVRLPSEDEWMVFAQCGDGREYPWGNEWPPRSGQAGNYDDQTTFDSGRVEGGYTDGFAVTCPVEESWANAWGLYGVGGNVWEITASRSDGAAFGAWRGASWNASTIRTSCGVPFASTTTGRIGTTTVGFGCCCLLRANSYPLYFVSLSLSRLGAEFVRIPEDGRERRNCDQFRSLQQRS